MQTVTALRCAGVLTAGWKLGRERPNMFGYRDNPIERGKPADVAKDLPDDIREQLRGLDMRAVDPKRLHELVANLVLEGYISDDACSQLAAYYVDYDRPIDVIALMKDAQSYLQGLRQSRWNYALRVYGAAIDAAESIQKLVDYLSGKLVDTYA